MRKRPASTEIKSKSAVKSANIDKPAANTSSSQVGPITHIATGPLIRGQPRIAVEGTTLVWRLDDRLKQLVAQANPLFERFAVDQGDWIALALAIALQHGYLDDAKGPGAPEKTLDAHFVAWKSVQSLLDRGGAKSTSEACKLARVSRSQFFRARETLLVQLFQKAWREAKCKTDFWAEIDSRPSPTDPMLGVISLPPLPRQWTELVVTGSDPDNPDG